MVVIVLLYSYNQADHRQVIAPGIVSGVLAFPMVAASAAASHKRRAAPETLFSDGLQRQNRCCVRESVCRQCVLVAASAVASHSHIPTLRYSTATTLHHFFYLPLKPLIHRGTYNFQTVLAPLPLQTNLGISALPVSSIPLS